MTNSCVYLPLHVGRKTETFTEVSMGGVWCCSGERLPLTTPCTGNRASGRTILQRLSRYGPPHRPLPPRLPLNEEARIMKRPSLHRLQPPQRGLYAYGRSHRAGTRGLHRRRSYRTRGMMALVMSGLLLVGAVVLGTSMPSRGTHHKPNGRNNFVLAEAEVIDLLRCGGFRRRSLLPPRPTRCGRRSPAPRLR